MPHLISISKKSYFHLIFVGEKMISNWFKFQSVWRKLVFLEAIPSQAGNLLRLKAVSLLILPRTGNMNFYYYYVFYCRLVRSLNRINKNTLQRRDCSGYRDWSACWSLQVSVNISTLMASVNSSSMNASSIYSCDSGASYYDAVTTRCLGQSHQSSCIASVSQH